MSEDPTRTLPPADQPTGELSVPQPITTAVRTSEGESVPPESLRGLDGIVRYRIVAEIARGGMGVVYQATDAILRRDVVVKVLAERFDAESTAASRFVDEARIAAQLQHPGIPAVHDLGALADGRPFLAMKLVKGLTLEELLQRRKDRASDRGRFLAHFEHVAQTVAYAHAHDVIHRDLKPANVMVGAFGEVQVMDWGLAKVLTEPIGQTEHFTADTRAGSAVVATRGAEDATRAGSILGTPAYMPPEQAIGAVNRIDRRSDVFGLGAILCTILTGAPPYVGADSEETRQLAARAELSAAFSRLDSCGADPELIELTKQCLASDPALRPSDAGEVAFAISVLRTDAEERARLAEHYRIEAVRKVRLHRNEYRILFVASLAVIVLMVASCVGINFLQDVF